ncbi:hypothetical protein LCL95_17020 [Bacillus timonensis]|nr:hypothetical protein [Bacillus timonensis]
MNIRKEQHKKGHICVFISFINSILLSTSYAFFGINGTIDLLIIAKMFVFILVFHLPIIISTYLNWRYSKAISFIGWCVLWIGFFLYAFQYQNTMKDLAIISWFLLVLITGNILAITVQFTMYVYIKLNKKKAI